MIQITTQLINVLENNSLAHYPSNVKKLYIRGNSKKILPTQNLQVVTRTYVVNPNNALSKYDFTFREF